jgi:hypothetical protein
MPVRRLPRRPVTDPATEGQGGECKEEHGDLHRLTLRSAAPAGKALAWRATGAQCEILCAMRYGTQLLVVALTAATVVGGCGGSSSSSSSATNGKTALAVLRSLKSAGLPVEAYVNYTAATDGNHLLGRPGQYVHKVNFRDTRLKAVSDFDIDGGGSVETFASGGRRKEALRLCSRDLDVGFAAVRGVRIPRRDGPASAIALPDPEQATAYQRALGSSG